MCCCSARCRPRAPPKATRRAACALCCSSLDTRCVCRRSHRASSKCSRPKRTTVYYCYYYYYSADDSKTRRSAPARRCWRACSISIRTRWSRTSSTCCESGAALVRRKRRSFKRCWNAPKNRLVFDAASSHTDNANAPPLRRGSLNQRLGPHHTLHNGFDYTCRGLENKTSALFEPPLHVIGYFH